MGLGRGSAVVLLLSLCFLVLYSEMAHAATYTVGGSAGWTFNSVGWTKGKRFRAGDTLGSYLPIILCSSKSICIIMYYRIFGTVFS